MTEKQYAAKVRCILKYTQIPIGQAEKKAGMGVGTLSRVIRGHGNMTLNQAQAIAEQAGYNMIDVITRDIVGDLDREKARKELDILRKREAELEARIGAEP